MAIRPDQTNLDEFVQVPASIIPANLNPEFWIVRTNDTLGGPKIYSTLEQFVNLHPNLMEVGMIATVNQHVRNSGTFAATQFKLDVIPELSKFPLSVSPVELDEAGNEVLVNGETVPVDNFYGDFWTVSQQFDLSSVETVYEYAPDINGLKPPFPYLDNPSAESSWVTEYDPATHKWLRSRSTNRQDSGTGIYLDWSIPLPINGNFETGDYTQNLFRRSATTPQLPKGITKDGLPNNNPSGWQDIPPTNSTDPLYEIRGQKDKFGNLKSAWIGPFLIPEDEDLIRYNSTATPNPNTIINSTTPATEGSQADIDLIAAGWVKTFDPTIHQYRAKRSENAPNDYTTWDVTKIANESGEYIDRIYKLFPINQDFDDLTFIQNNTPTGNDPLSNPQGLVRNENWYDVQQNEDETHINGYSEARKFIDGSLKTPWTSPKPFTGKDTYIDYIRSNGESSFKYASSDDTSPDPATITLEFFLFKGNNEVTNNITYQWTKIYDNRTVVNVPLGTSKTQVITPTDVSGKAIFRCTATLAIADGDDIIFVEEESIVDITDGDDAKSLVLSSETPIVLYDTSGSAFSVDTITVRGFQSFLTGTTFYWYKDDGAGNWIDISANNDYTLTNQTLSIATADLFTADGTKQVARFALSTADLPADVENNDEFYDVISISKLSSAGVGAAGEDAITISMSDEVDSAILDRATVLPQAGEIGSTGTVKNLIKVFNGVTKLTYSTEWTITSITSNVTDITFAHQDGGTNDREVYVDTWTNSGTRKVTATININIVGVGDFVKNFTVTTNLDDAGAVIGFVDIASDSLNKTLSFTPEERRDIKLVAILDQNGSIITPASFDGNVIWYFNGLQTNTNISGTNNSAKLVTRADVVGSLAVKAKITYNGQEYFTTPVNIDDISDASNFILYHHFGTVPAEPIATPTKPADTAVSAFESTFALTPSGTGYFREPGANSYFYSIGQVEVIGGIDTIVFNKALRFRGEKGEQGPTPDFIVVYYKTNETNLTPSLPSSNATRNQMLADGWKVAPALTTGTFLFEATTTFNGEDINNLDAAPTENWLVTKGEGIDGINGWTPVLDGEELASGEAYVLKVIDWFGGGGTKPNINEYLSASGYTPNIANATRFFIDSDLRFTDIIDSKIFTKTTLSGANFEAQANSTLTTPSDPFVLVVNSLEYINTEFPSGIDVSGAQQYAENSKCKINAITIPGQIETHPVTVYAVVYEYTSGNPSLLFSKTLTGKSSYNFADVFTAENPITSGAFESGPNKISFFGVEFYYDLDDLVGTGWSTVLPNTIGNISYGINNSPLNIGDIRQVNEGLVNTLISNNVLSGINLNDTYSVITAPTYSIQMTLELEVTATSLTDTEISVQVSANPANVFNPVVSANTTSNITLKSTFSADVVEDSPGIYSVSESIAIDGRQSDTIVKLVSYTFNLVRNI